MTIDEFAVELIGALGREPIPPAIDGEQDFKKRFVIPEAARIDHAQRTVLLYAPPFLNKECCTPPCAKDPPAHSGRVTGCPECWANMKPWGSVVAFGTHHTFDLVAKDPSQQTLAVEAKLAEVSKGRKPNAQIQQFLGQCSLAATKHHVVIGICGDRGQWYEDTGQVRKWFESRDVRLVFRRVA